MKKCFLILPMFLEMQKNVFNLRFGFLRVSFLFFNNKISTWSNVYASRFRQKKLL